MSLCLQIKNTHAELPVWTYRWVCVQVWKVAYHMVHSSATCPQALSTRAWIQNQNFSGRDLKEILFCSRRGVKKREHNTNQTTEGKQTWNEHWELRKKINKTCKLNIYHLTETTVQNEKQILKYPSHMYLIISWSWFHICSPCLSFPLTGFNFFSLFLNVILFGVSSLHSMWIPRQWVPENLTWSGESAVIL